MSSAMVLVLQLGIPSRWTLLADAFSDHKDKHHFSSDRSVMAPMKKISDDNLTGKRLKQTSDTVKQPAVSHLS